MTEFKTRIQNVIHGFLSAEKEVQIRTIMLFIAVVNLILYICGKNQISANAEEIWGWCTTVIMLIASVRAWWKNNSFTEAAKSADEIMKTAKQTVYEEIEYDEFITENENS